MKASLFIWFMFTVIVAFSQTDKKHDFTKYENVENDELSRIRKIERNGIDSIKAPTLNFNEFEKRIEQSKYPIFYPDKEKKLELFYQEEKEINEKNIKIDENEVK